MTQLPPIPTSVPQLTIESARFRQALYSRNTLEGYSHDWLMFRRWCERMERSHLPADPETVCLYLTALLTQGRKISTADRRASAIAHHHRQSGIESPVTKHVRALLTGARRIRRERPKQERALQIPELRKMCAVLTRDGTPIALRNRAILVVGFLSALRRSNLVELRTSDIEFTRQGVILDIHHEKQDQAGRGRSIGVPRGKRPDTCPVRCLREWLKIRGDEPGPLFTRFRRGKGPIAGALVCRVVKALAQRIGLDPTLYGAHSLRAGFVTAAGEAGATDLLIATQTGHRSIAVLRRYFRRTNLFRANAAAKIGL